MNQLTYKVYHKAFEPEAAHVANVYIDSDVPTLKALEEVFRKTNNVEGSWSLGPKLTRYEDEYDDSYEPFTQPKTIEEDNLDYFKNVEVVKYLRLNNDDDLMKYYGHRSTSVGDYVVVDGRTYTCENFGWGGIA